ncbi:MAG TPA: response regulator [Bacteriovoracaceae bacterium]|nr:response regulator [Bacteriovoracaceae bacterium]
MLETKSILVIEDDHDIRVAIRQSLEDCGYYVHSVSNGWDGLTLLERIAAPSLIILDLSMPIMNGEEFLKLKVLNQKIVDIPVLVTSCHENRLSALADYPTMKKPIDMEVFLKKVASCIKV